MRFGKTSFLYLWFSVPVVFCICALLYLYSSVPVLFCTCTLLYLYSSVPVLFCTCALLYLYSSVPVLFCTCTPVLFCACAIFQLYIHDRFFLQLSRKKIKIRSGYRFLKFVIGTHFYSETGSIPIGFQDLNFLQNNFFEPKPDSLYPILILLLKAFVLLDFLLPP
jgi:hypothetical protein